MGSITDVTGIRVGHFEREGEGWLSGTTVILPPQGTVGSVDVRGGGPGTHETDALDPTTLVPGVDAVVLTGGSAYGLAAAHGAQRWLEEQGRGFEVVGGVVPIVPAAAIFDLGRGGDFAARPDESFGYAAAARAAAPAGLRPERGNVGAGTGAVIAQGSAKGGVGMASICLEDGIVVAALAVVNALGAPRQAAADLCSSNEAKPGAEAENGGVGVGGPGLNTTLAVVVTNLKLDPAQCKRTATAAHAGLARALDPSHTLADGDTIFALSTQEKAAPDTLSAMESTQLLIRMQSAAAHAVEQAILDGIGAAQSVSTPAGTFARLPLS